MCEGHKYMLRGKRFGRKENVRFVSKINIKAKTIKLYLRKKGTFRVLALDQATKITGYSIFDNKKLIYYGIF